MTWRQWTVMLGMWVIVPVLVGTTHAATCRTDYSWQCSDSTPNNCVGFWSANTWIFTEDENNDNELWYVFRFEDLPAGPHAFRIGGAAQEYVGNPVTVEEFQVGWKQKNDCDENDIRYQIIGTWDEDGPAQVIDYDIGSPTTTDICIGVSSKTVNGNGPFSLDEFFISYIPTESMEITTFPSSENAAGDFLTNPGTIVAGNYTRTFASDNSREKLREGGIRHRLWHVWKFENIQPGASHTLYVEGRRPNSDDGDNFRILTRWDSDCSGPFLPINGLVIDSSSETTKSATVGSGSDSGTLCVAIDDTGNFDSFDDDVYVDHLYVLTQPDCN